MMQKDDLWKHEWVEGKNEVKHTQKGMQLLLCSIIQKRQNKVRYIHKKGSALTQTFCVAPTYITKGCEEQCYINCD